MFARRTVFAVARRVPARALAKRTFSSSVVRCEVSKWDPKPGEAPGKYVALEDIKGPHDLLAPGGKPGTMPTDYEQATGLDRLEILGKMQGIDVFDLKPLDSSRLGTFEDPILVKSGGDEQYAGCTGSPADSHGVVWMTITKDRPFERCGECGSVVKMQYIGPETHDDHHHGYEEPKTFADFVKPEYWYK
ncbi:hypothetical protein AJ80_08011 [Polytolypa hystricis UAMH7299]|uniref:Cytochrome c oxidase subunit 4, mitochondrial n=1 Tax=Polytolypa hystricis (strain UAMH7299) TaxID=1447883 RepID=A0A2B7XEQ0_POLH7|nr:hypothetical protein AJ80_08011 [Polytolypa hystricis UAMH7299]